MAKEMNCLDKLGLSQFQGELCLVRMNIAKTILVPLQMLLICSDFLADETCQKSSKLFQA